MTRTGALHSNALLPALLLAISAFTPSPGARAADTAPADGRARISETACRGGAFDHTDRFPPVRDQGAQGQCFAFAAAGLLDEHAFASGEAPAGTRFSAIDIARDYPDKSDWAGRVDVMDPAWDRDFFNLANANQGGLEFELLDAALEFGVCKEEDAPYFPRLDHACKSMSDRSGCVIGGLKSLWKKHERITRRLRCNDSNGSAPDSRNDPLSDREREKIESILDKLEDLLQPQVTNGLDLTWALNASSSEFDFVERVLIPPSCETRRHYFGGSSWSENWTTDLQWYDRQKKSGSDGSTTTTISAGARTHESHYSNDERFMRLSSRARETGRSLALGLCSKSATSSSKTRRDDPRSAETCGPHALIANGIRWNSEQSRCELHIRNSWGADTRLQGWLPVEPILNSTFRVSGIAP